MASLTAYFLFPVSRQLSANHGAPVSHAALQPNLAVRLGGEKLGGGHVATVTWDREQKWTGTEGTGDWLFGLVEG